MSENQNQAEMDALRAEVQRLRAENHALRSENEAFRRGGQGPISVVVRRMSGEEAAVIEVDGLGMSVADLKTKIARQLGVTAPSFRLCTSRGALLSTHSRPATLADALYGTPLLDQRLELTMAVSQQAWQSSEHFSLDQDATLATRITETNARWAVLRSTALVAPEGSSEFTVRIVNDPSDGCWMLGVMAVSPAPLSFLADSHGREHQDYRGALLYRSDNGDVWFDGVKQPRVEESGMATGKVARVLLERQSPGQFNMTIQGTSHSGRDIQISAGGFLEHAPLNFVILTYRNLSSFSLIGP